MEVAGCISYRVTVMTAAPITEQRTTAVTSVRFAAGAIFLLEDKQHAHARGQFAA